MKTYELGERDGHAFIRCLRCGLESFHPMDVEERFCGHCKDWHEHMTEAQLEALKPCFAHQTRSCPKCEKFRAPEAEGFVREVLAQGGGEITFAQLQAFAAKLKTNGLP